MLVTVQIFFVFLCLTTTVSCKSKQQSLIQTLSETVKTIDQDLIQKLGTSDLYKWYKDVKDQHIHKKLEQLLTRYEGLQKDIDDLQKLYDDWKNKTATDDSSQVIIELGNRTQQFNEHLEIIRNAIQNHTAILEKLGKRDKTLDLTLSKQENYYPYLSAKVTILEKTLNGTQKQIHSYNEKCREITNVIKKNKKRNEKMMEQVQEMKRENTLLRTVVQHLETALGETRTRGVSPHHITSRKKANGRGKVIDITVTT